MKLKAFTLTVAVILFGVLFLSLSTTSICLAKNESSVAAGPDQEDYLENGMNQDREDDTIMPETDSGEEEYDTLPGEDAPNLEDPGSYGDGDETNTDIEPDLDTEDLYEDNFNPGMPPEDENSPGYQDSPVYNDDFENPMEAPPMDSEGGE